jgi:hypothetical protein
MAITHHETLDQKPAIQTVTFGIGTCTLGLALVAATSQGICAILTLERRRSSPPCRPHP